MFGKDKLCWVCCHGDVQDRYTQDNTLWVEREEDYYAMGHYTKPFCVLRRDDFIAGELLTSAVMEDTR